MDDRKEKKDGPWLSVPQFGDWDMKNGRVPDYSLDFSKIRENRKQNKRDASRASIGNDEDLVPTDHHSGAPSTTTDPPINRCREDDDPTSTRRSIFSCFNCFVRA
ncbi:hypothetical protein MLD38_019500 [Melastoma candidum]|uniref:Uncharacterized protein n=1 Tax=Melastoma candidum TaxID=119954 RepID=A0ACB9R188_9MYRT|nr:hypothetical protein MLD38_019500 [Melastoma candidum]